MSLGQSTGLSDTGRKRRRNEDAFVCEPPLFAVADGMGGAQAGELASRLAAAALREDAGESTGEEKVTELIQAANRRVYERSSSDESAQGMGTTMTVALVEDGYVRIGHVGDSRAYRIRAGTLEQLTEDHSLVAELVRSGKLAPEEADTHPQRSVITRALGTDPDVDVDTLSIDARTGDLFLLCSDGLTSMVADDAILAVVERHRRDVARAARELVAAANRSGGEDNITVVFFEIAETATDEAETGLLSPEDTARDADDEDTLSGIEAVPAVGTMIVSPRELDDWLAQPAAGAGRLPAPEPPRRRRSGRRRTLWLTLALIVIALAAGTLWGLSRAHFVGAEPDGHIAVYQGFPWNIAGRVRLYRTVYVSPLLAGQLTQAERKKLFDHDLHSKTTTLDEVKAYEREIGP
jgi:protein phosphatase